jgi:outer membrane beta-barrel protein
MPMLSNKHRFALLIALATVSLPFAAQAQRKSPLADAPAIRKRFELRQTRFEASVGAGSTVNQDFFHTVLIDVRLAFHVTDWLAVGVFGDFGVAQVATGYENKLVNSLDPMGGGNVNREPNQAYAQAGLQQISGVFGAQLEWTPFTGKYALFGKLFSAYDFYVAIPGVAAMQVKPKGGAPSPLRSCDSAPPMDPTSPDRYVCGVNGTKIGGTVAVGIHSYFGQSVALGVELRDVIAQLNPSGRDVNGDLVADSNDLSWTNTWIITANLAVYLPFQAKVSP